MDWARQCGRPDCGTARQPAGRLQAGVPVFNVSPVLTLGEQVVAFARGEIGKHPYVWGDKTPEGGLDCSGFTQWCFQQIGVNIGSGTWFQREYCKKHGVFVDKGYEAGDLLFWMNEGAVTPSHVGIASGKGTVIEETASYDNVVEVPEKPRWTQAYVEGWRIL